MKAADETVGAAVFSPQELSNKKYAPMNAHLLSTFNE